MAFAILHSLPKIATKCKVNRTVRLLKKLLFLKNWNKDFIVGNVDNIWFILFFTFYSGTSIIVSSKDKHSLFIFIF